MRLCVCVYCSSSDRVGPAYVAVAEALGWGLGEAGWDLVYGGASCGLMGRVASAAKAAGARVIGVLPELFVGHGIDFPDCDEAIVTHDMRSRKQTMESRADAFIALPGGFGTLEELLEMITLKQLGVHAMPIVILNADGFFDPLLAQFERCFAEHFTCPEHRALYTVAASPEAAIAAIAAYRPAPVTPKWG